jgi:hypothetical protein
MGEVRRVIEGMLAAVSVERRAVEESRPRADSLRRGDDVRPVPGSQGSAYGFRMATWPPSWQSGSVLVRAGASLPWLHAEVESVSATAGAGGYQVVITVQTPLPPGVRAVQVREDEAASLRVLTGRLQDLAAVSAEQVRLGAAVTGGRVQTNTGVEREVTAQVLAFGQTRWNTEQERAVGQALGSELTFIWGPPGTGKTEVLAAVIEGSYRQGHRVLFLAPTHVAVDQALLRVCERLQAEPGFDRGLVHRDKGAQLSDLSDRFGTYIDRRQVESRLMAGLHRQGEQLRAERSRLSGLVAGLRELEVVERAASDLSGRARAAEAAVAQEDRLVERAEQQIAALDQKISDAGSGAGVGGAWRRRRLPELTRQRAEAEVNRQHALAGQAARVRELGRVREQLSLAERRRQHLLGELGSTRPSGQGLRQALARVGEDLKRVEVERANVQATVQSTIRVTASTVAGAVSDRLARGEFDTVVLDEAGMVDLASAFAVTALARRRVVIAGDFRQLPAIVKANPDRLRGTDRSAWKTWYARDVFTAAGMTTEAGQLTGNSRLVALREQYRMRPAICDLVNVVAYGDEPLRTGRADTSRVVPSPLLSGPLVLIDTSGRVIAQPRGRNVNPVHSAVIRELVRGLQYDTVLPARRDQDTDPTTVLGVIAPYRDQVKALDRQLTERFGSNYEGLVDTVHRFQGSQRPVILLDTVAGGSGTLGWFYQGVGTASQTCRLLNVALSRAQDHLVVVADLDAFERLAPVGSEVQVMMNHLRRNAHVLPVTELVPIRSAADLAGLDETERERPAFFPADEVLPAIAWDIERARTRIDLFSPFLNTPATNRWLKPLREAVARGIRVVVTTRNHRPDDLQGRLCDQLRQAGIVVVQGREAMHEKILIIDDIVWHGSLNLLAHLRSTELMMRLVSSTSVEQVRRIIDRARPTRAAAPYEQRASTDGRSPAKIRPPDTPDRVYLDVPFSDNAHVKREGARFDREHKLWYIDPARTPRERVARWLPAT